MKSTRKKDIKYGKKDIIRPDEFDPKFGMERISLMVDMQVVDAFRALADKEGKKYQVLIREALREKIFSSKMKELEDRLDKLEKIILKK